jgi:hypothetical protein
VELSAPEFVALSVTSDLKHFTQERFSPALSVPQRGQRMETLQEVDVRQPHYNLSNHFFDNSIK